MRTILADSTADVFPIPSTSAANGPGYDNNAPDRQVPLSGVSHARHLGRHYIRAAFVGAGGNEARKCLLFAHKCLLGATVTAEANTARMMAPPAMATLSGLPMYRTD